MANAMTRVVTFITTLLLRLHNDVWVEGTHLPFGGYIAKVEGDTKLLGVNDVAEVRPFDRAFQMITQIIAQQTAGRTVVRKGAKVEIFHFVQMVNGVAWRIITNNMSATELVSYRESVARQQMVNDLFAISTGDWEFNFLLRMMKTRETKFRVAILPNGEVDPGVLSGLHQRSSFAWASAGYSFFVKFAGQNTWGLQPLGLTALDTQKVSKRLQEVCRLSEMHLHIEKASDFRLMEYPRPEGMDAKLVDGKSFISKAFALRLAYSATGKRRKNLVHGIDDGTITSFSIRVMGPFGLIKGDAYIHSDVNAAFDVLTDAENIKTDVRTDGYVFATIWEHHTLGRAKWDDQSAINFASVLPTTRRSADLALAVAKIKAHVNNGEIPEDLLLPESAHHDDGTPNLEQLSDQLRSNRVRWQAAGQDVRMAQNLVYMWLNGFLKNMERDMVRPGVFKKTHVAMSNAFVGTVATWSLMTKVGGYRFPDQDGTKVFFDERFGLVIPDQRFIDTFDLHGTWDLDDTAKAVFVKVFGATAHVASLVQDGVLPTDVEIPTTQADAVDMVAFIRSPNGPGEISFEVMDELTMPWFDYDEKAITVVDLATIKSQGQLLASVPAGILPSSIVYTKSDLTSVQAWRMIKAQQGNPGIGSTANAVMVWYNTFRSMPQMAGTLGDVVDAVQQGADAVSFSAVQNAAQGLWDDFASKVITSGRRVDADLIRARAPKEIADLVKAHMVDGELTQFNKQYAAAIADLRTHVANVTLQMRQVHQMTRMVTTLNFGPEPMKWAADTYARWVKILNAIQRDPRYNTAGRDPFTALTIKRNQSQARHGAVDSFINDLLAFERPHQRVLCLWKYILTPAKSMPLGHSDQVIFQPGSNNLAVMDLLIQALALRGWGHEVPLP